REGVLLLGVLHGGWVSPVHTGPGLTEPVSVVLLPGLCSERTMPELPTPPGTDPGELPRKIRFAATGGEAATRAPTARLTEANVKLTLFMADCSCSRRTNVWLILC